MHTTTNDGSALFKRGDGSTHKCWSFTSADGSTRCRSCGLHPDQCSCTTHPASCGCDTTGYACPLHRTIGGIRPPGERHTRVAGGEA